ncbi:hypothetical protein ACVWXL_003307 [Bradyrhizobium sp. GM22.5]
MNAPPRAKPSVSVSPSFSVTDVSVATGLPAMSALRGAPEIATRTAPSRAVNAAPNGPTSTAAANGSLPTSVFAAASDRRSIAPLTVRP